METWHSLILGSGAALCAVALGLERHRHEQLLRSFSPRIVVTGTRGKSSVTRLIRAGLAARYPGTFAKTTGTLPRLIHPDGSEEPIIRAGKPSVLEQLSILRRAGALGGKAIVSECMALQPENHFLFVDSLVRPTHTVVTNVRPDHLEIMGPTVRSVAETLASVTPIEGKLFVPRGRFEEVFAFAARDRGSELVEVETDGVVGEDELRPFDYVEHAENVALALAVTTELGVPRAEALAAMQQMRPDPGALLVGVAQGVLPYRFVGAFAANDPESTLRLYRNCVGLYADAPLRAVAMNCRADRIERSLSLAATFAAEPSVDHFFLLGEGTAAFESALASADGLRRPCTVIDASEPMLADRLLAKHLLPGALVVGIGNIGGVGLRLTEYLLGKDLRGTDFRSDTSPTLRRSDGK